jgi:hypothetical protein
MVEVDQLFIPIIILSAFNSVFKTDVNFILFIFAYLIWKKKEI